MQSSKPDTETGDAHPTFDPKAIGRFCDVLTGLFDKHSKLEHTKLSHLNKTKIMKELDEKHPGELQAFVHYYKKATLETKISSKAAVDLVKAFVSDGESVELHHNFPKHPLGAFTHFLHDHGVGNFTKHDAEKAEFEDPTVKRKYEDIHESELKDYAKQLKDFIAEEEELNESQIAFVKERIHALEKKIEAGAPKKQKLDKEEQQA